MKKYNVLFIVLLLYVFFIKCDEDNDSLCQLSANSLEDCQDLLNDEEKSEKKHCCLYTSDQDQQCLLLKDDEYNEIEKVKSDYIAKGKSNVEIDCKSYYLKLSYFLLFYFI